MFNIGYYSNGSVSSSFALVFSSPAILSLIFARILYAVNWFNIASIFYLIAIDFKQDLSMLGLVSFKALQVYLLQAYH